MINKAVRPPHSAGLIEGNQHLTGPREWLLKAPEG